MQKFNFRINDTEELECPDTQFDVSATDLDSAIPLLYQSGYLTIKEFYPEMNLYRLDIPNKEVRIGMLESLYPSVFPNLENKNEFWIWKFAKDIKLGNTDSFMTRLKSLIASMPYATGKNAELVNEQNIQNGFFLIFNLMGQFTRSEVHSLKGRSDCAVETSDTVYLFEFKISGNGTADDALAQIDKKDYTCSYEAGGKRIVKIGVAFDKDVREFADVKIVM